MTHICVSDLTPSLVQIMACRLVGDIIRTNAGILLIRPLGTNFSAISTEILSFSFKKKRLKVSSAKWRLFRLGLNVLRSQFKGQGHMLTMPLWLLNGHNSVKLLIIKMKQNWNVGNSYGYVATITKIQFHFCLASRIAWCHIWRSYWMIVELEVWI